MGMTMAIDRTELDAHLKNFRDVTGVQKDRFVCPISGQEVAEYDLINGHIVNEAIRGAARRTVIQWGKLDHHYGTHVEPPLVAHINYLHLSASERIGAGERLIRFADGTLAEAQLAATTAGVFMAKKFAVMAVEEYDGTVRPYVLKGVFPTDPRLRQDDDRLLLVAREFLHEHHNAAALKAGFLLLFDLFGYQVLSSAVFGSVRRVLHEFFAKGLTFNDVPSHFKDFMGAMSLVSGWSKVPAHEGDTGLDSVLRREFLALRDGTGNLFSLGVVLPVGKIWLLVWMPFGSPVSERELCTLYRHYFGYIRDEPVASYSLHPARMRIDGRGVHQLDVGPAIDVSLVEYGQVVDAINSRLGRANEPPMLPGEDAAVRHFEARRRRR
jgi:hypothetical protein